MITRDMEAADLPAVLEIERQSFTTPWSETSFLNEIHSRRSITRVAQQDDILIGYICLKVILDEGHLLDLAIHPSHRQKGVARALFVDALEKIRTMGCSSLYLEVRVSNTAALGLYEKLGFRHVGTRRVYYDSPPEDGAVMVLDLTTCV